MDPREAAQGRSPEEPGRSRRTRIRRHAQLYFIVALPFGFLVTFNYWPMLGAQIAFRDYNPVQGMFGSPWIGLSEFRQFVQSPYFSIVIHNTLTLSIYSLIVGTPTALILALAINEVKHARFKRIAQMVTYAPYFISAVVLVGMIDLVLAPQGSLLSQTLHLFGIHQVPDLLASPGDFPSLYVWSGVWQTTGYSAVIYLAALSAVNPELYDAAWLDGASRPQKIHYVDFPAIMPVVVIVLILSVGGILSVGFEKAYLMQNPLEPVQLRDHLNVRLQNWAPLRQLQLRNGGRVIQFPRRVRPPPDHQHHRSLCIWCQPFLIELTPRKGTTWLRLHCHGKMKMKEARGDRVFLFAIYAFLVVVILVIAHPGDLYRGCILLLGVRRCSVARCGSGRSISPLPATRRCSTTPRFGPRTSTPLSTPLRPPCSPSC